MLRVAVLVSGGGSNLQAILDSIGSGELPNTDVAVVISSNRDAGALKRAELAGLPMETLHRKEFESPESYDEALLERLSRYSPDLIVLAGFMVLLGDGVLEQYRNRIINVHPSLIPSFCGKGCYGLHPHKAALEYGVKVTGATVHFVDRETDGGPIIFQKAVSVLEGDTPKTLQQRVMEEAEWKLLPKAIRFFGEGKLKLEGRIVKILNGQGEASE